MLSIRLRARVLLGALSVFQSATVGGPGFGDVYPRPRGGYAEEGRWQPSEGEDVFYPMSGSIPSLVSIPIRSDVPHNSAILPFSIHFTILHPEQNHRFPLGVPPRGLGHPWVRTGVGAGHHEVRADVVVFRDLVL